MKKTVNVVMALALSICMAACASDIQRTTTADGVGASRVGVARATVVDIDYEKHTAVLKDADGQMQLVNVGPDAPNFSQVKVGDTVISEVVESVTLVVGDSAEAPALRTFEETERYPDKPGAEKVVVTEASARVEKINYEERLITLVGSNGKRITMEAGPEVKRLNEIKQGDMITLRKSKQTIIRVETP